ncbi:hypothetical protein [Mesorhizobium onobrychidis]|uniref:hypothetical protein n=1 Tax=Mesorhizobium onobrychidis TaxID=2775404 RepID=UPI0021575047|nr:hypothetical protein [Mesorhizobium onobrychidis]
MAKHPDYPGASSRVVNGKEYWRFRANRHARQIALPGQPGDEAFEACYRRAVEGCIGKSEIIDMPGRVLSRSFGHAARRLETTMEWADFDPATQAKNSNLIERFLNMPVDPEHVLTWRDVPVEYMDPTGFARSSKVSLRQTAPSPNTCW